MPITAQEQHSCGFDVTKPFKKELFFVGEMIPSLPPGLVIISPTKKSSFLNVYCSVGTFTGEVQGTEVSFPYYGPFNHPVIQFIIPGISGSGSKRWTGQFIQRVWHILVVPNEFGGMPITAQEHYSFGFNVTKPFKKLFFLLGVMIPSIPLRLVIEKLTAAGNDLKGSGRHEKCIF